MMRSHDKGLPNLAIFSLGISFFLYAFMQYVFTPLCWWLSQHMESLAWMNAIFVFLEMKGLDVFTQQSIVYSLLGLSAFFCGYLLLSTKFAKINSVFMSQGWDVDRAEKIFWLLVLSGFAIKALKIAAGLDVAIVVSDHIKHSFISNPFIVFFLSLNWFHLIGLVVINIAYQEAKKNSHPAMRRLRVLAYVANFLFLAVSLSTGGKTATLFPVLGLMIIRQFYIPFRISLLKFILRMMFFLVFIFFVKHLLSVVFESAELDSDNIGFLFAFFYLLFYRVNMSAVMAAVIEKGQQVFPDGTLGQFWVDLSLYGSEKTNIFDGNEFGRAMGIAEPGDFVTGVASTNMGELYINFGLVGILLGMFLTGVLYKIFFANCRQRLPVFVMLYALMWPILIHGMESPITVLYATSIKMILMCVIVHFAITLKFVTASQRN